MIEVGIKTRTDIKESVFLEFFSFPPENDYCISSLQKSRRYSKTLGSYRGDKTLTTSYCMMYS